MDSVNERTPAQLVCVLFVKERYCARFRIENERC
ncbi:hypothetical protein CLV58_12425 [Spirosoma oryzae]|uniref:Uncharacterized protein n=1 Tax=Spirosoma oryzae TaxID=1469603 RepID=A0A2T0SAF3_9BACT|nr:hypothetical protein CLV58_12425 [Spirosoma oryzae]